jgi:hypothetical protein
LACLHAGQSTAFCLILGSSGFVRKHVEHARADLCLFVCPCAIPVPTGIIVDIVRSWSDLGGPTVLMMLAHLATSQTHCGSIPLKALQVRITQVTQVTQVCSIGQHLTVFLAMCCVLSARLCRARS